MAKNKITKRIERIQRHLGVEDDGIIGPATLTALENILFDEEQKAAGEADYALTVSKAGLQKLVAHEISSAAYYRRFLAHPTWPGGNSGITIGIGYDLGQNNRAQIRQDWSGLLSELDLERLLVVAGLKGEAAGQALKGVKNVSIPLELAQKVFYEATLPRYAKMTLKTYPGVERLHPDSQSAILSLVYNRGTSLKGARRKEMAAIRKLVKQQDYDGISFQIRSMKRLWEGKGLDGLLKRRDEEALLVSKKDRNYGEDEIMRV